MKRFILLPLLLSSCLQSSPPKDQELKEFRLEDTYMHPIKPEPSCRYDDQDICEIFWDKELLYEYDCQDHPTPDLGQPSPASDK